MTDDRYVVAIEISSSKIIAGVGTPRPDGRLDVLALEQEKIVECVRRGFIHNIEETFLRLKRILEKLERRPSISPKKVKSLFVGISGRSMRSVAVETSLHLPEETIVTADIIAKLRRQAEQTPIDGSLEIVDVVPRRFLVDKTETNSPQGTLCKNSISATYDLIVARPELTKNIERVVEDKLGLKIVGFIVTALSTAHLVLSNDQKRLGCMLVDIGAETTCVSIYKQGALRYYATLPMGSQNITDDITTLSVLPEQAEEIKISTGNALASQTRSTLNINGVNMAEVSDLVVARSEEIVANIIAQVQYAGLKFTDLPGGIVALGGGSKLQGMTELLHKQTDLPVRLAELPAYINIEETKLPTHETIEVVSLLYSAVTKTDANCMEALVGEELPVLGEEPEEEPEENPKKGARKPHGPEIRVSDFFSKLTSKISNMFTPQDDDMDDELG